MSPARRRVRRALVLGVAVSVAVTLLSRIGVLAGWETRVVDAFVFLRARQVEPEIALVTIDDEAFASLGERQPLPREYLAALADLLLASGARVVAFDLAVGAPGDGDAALVATSERAAMRGQGRLVFAAPARPEAGSSGERYALRRAFSPALRAIAGFSNAPVGADGVIRRMMPVLPAASGGYLPSFALAALASADASSAARLAEALAGGGAELSLPARSADGALALDAISLSALATPWRIDFSGPPGTFTAFPSGPIADVARTALAPPDDNPFRGKIVLVGATFAESRDLHPTPVGLMSGVEIQAHMIHTLMARRALRPPPWALNLALLMALCAGIALLSLWLRPLWLVPAALALIAAVAALSYEAFARRGYWIDCVAPAFAMIGYIQAARWLDRQRIRSAFGQYVSVEVLDRVLREGSDLGGETREITVLMSDVRGFTTLSERLPPARISEIMNEYFAEMVDVILAHRGMVNDFIGDGMLALFGAPLADPDHAWHAVESARGMQAALARLNARWAAAGRPTLAMGVAINTGPAFVGNMGSARRKKYSVLGDTVNTVARIEAQNRDLGTSILVSAGTLAHVTDRVAVRDRGRVALKGKAEPVAIYELEPAP